jgi:hypothetical protein
MLVHTDNDAAATVEGAAGKEHAISVHVVVPIKPKE